MLHPISKSWCDFEDIIQSFLNSQKISSVLELGAGANPFLSEQTVKKYNLKYFIQDIDPEDLNKNSDGYYKKIQIDLSINTLNQKYDLIFSKMVLEHVKDPLSLHKNLLKSGHEKTIFCHFFSSKYGLPSILNLTLPKSLSESIVYKIQKRDPSLEGKFPAYYKKCTGPLKSTSEWYKNLGYTIENFNGYLGHSYTGKNKFLHFFESHLSKLVQKINSPLFCSNAILVMKKNSDNE